MTTYEIDPTRIERNWHAITAELDAPQPSRIEKLLTAVGVPARLSRLALATPSLRRVWYVVTGLVILLGLAGADTTADRESIFGFLVVAPLIPVMGVAMAYGSASDPAHEIGLATPMRGLRLVLTRTFVVLVFSTIALALVALFSANGLAFAWLLPGLALTAASLALSTVFAPRRAAGLAASVWLAIMTVARVASEDRLGVFGPAGQLLALAITVMACAVTYQRRDRFDLLEARL